MPFRSPRRPAGPPPTGARWAAAIAVAAVAAAGCSGGGSTAAPAPSATPTPAAARGAACPTTYRAPDPARPVVTLTFDLAADHSRVTGHERVVFTPDKLVDELVFRLIANGSEQGRAGSTLRVTRTSVLGSTRARYAADGARPGTQGSLVRLPLPRAVPAGTAVTADLDFVLTLGPPSFDRYGHTAATAWWGSGHPLLAWERGRGWAEEPTTSRSAEIASSEAARTDVTVTAPAADTVLSTGLADPAGPTSAGSGRRRWHSTAAAARDVAVMAGHFRTAHATVAGVPLTAAVAPEVRSAPAAVLAALERAVRGHAARFGPFPYESMVAAALPGIGSGGVEYPGAVMLGDGNLTQTTAHEVAHEWFYGLVGDDQARDPWLDEGFATYAEALLDGAAAAYAPLLTQPRPVDTPMTGFADDSAYEVTVYGKGAAALLAARTAAGPARFDAALRCYTAANAWRIATPADVAAALTGLPAALAVLRRAGAIPG